LWERLPKERYQRQFRHQVMIDRGDHVEWANGKRVWKFRLPDQADNDADYPVVTTVVISADMTNYSIDNVAQYKVVFTDQSGLIRGRVAASSVDGVPKAMFDQILPPEAFAALEERGVTVVHEVTKSIRQFYRDPGRHTIGPFYTWVSRTQK
jgi:hypothetical protein